MRCKTLVLFVTLIVASIIVPDVIAQQWAGNGRIKGLVNVNMSANADALRDFEKLLELAPESAQAIEVTDLYLEYLRSQVSQ